MKIRSVVAMAIVLMAPLLLSACAGKSYVVLLENPDGSTGKILVQGAKGEQIIASARQRPAVDVSIIGHTDTQGSAVQNDALALRRAQTIAELMQQQGLLPHALLIESPGEHNLLVATPDETAEPRNRRVEISLR